MALLTWEQDAFAYAESYDEAEGRYRGLQFCRRLSNPDADLSGLLVRPEVARRRITTPQKSNLEFLISLRNKIHLTSVIIVLSGVQNIAGGSRSRKAWPADGGPTRGIEDRPRRAAAAG